MGLLGTSWDDPKTAATLQLVSGLLGNSNFGRGASQGLLGYSQALQQQKQQKQLEELKNLQMQQMQQQLQMQQEAAAQRQKDQGLLRQQFSPLAGPTPDGGPLMPRFDPASMIGQGGSIDAVTQAAQVQSMLNPQRKLMNVAPGASVIDETGKTVFQAPDKPEKDPEDIRVLKMIYGEGSPAYLAALKRLGQKKVTHQPGVSVSYGAPVAGVDAKGNPVFFQPSKDGSAPSIVQGVAPPKTDKPLTEAQAKAAAFKSQMEAAEKELSTIPIDQTRLSSQVDVGIAGGLTNLIASPVAQRARQSQEQWAESYLRFKTGAASTEAEVKRNVRTFFPQPGDSAGVIEQKARMRQQAIHDVSLAAGNKKAEPGEASAPASSDGWSIKPR